MKKFLGLMLICLTATLTTYAYDGIYENSTVIYNPTTKHFSTKGDAPSRIVLTKKTSSGTGSYSEYYAPNGKLVLMTGGNFEFINDGQLISVHNAELKFFKIAFEEGEYKEFELNEDEVQKLFPDAKIVKISDFIDNKYTLNKTFLKKKKVLILNDTTQNFYKYSWNCKSCADKEITGLLTVRYPLTLKFSHFNDNSKDFPALKIFVKH